VGLRGAGTATEMLAMQRDGRVGDIGQLRMTRRDDTFGDPAQLSDSLDQSICSLPPENLANIRLAQQKYYGKRCNRRKSD
jgi:hypothetical protein